MRKGCVIRPSFSPARLRRPSQASSIYHNMVVGYMKAQKRRGEVLEAIASALRNFGSLSAEGGALAQVRIICTYQGLADADRRLKLEKYSSVTHVGVWKVSSHLQAWLPVVTTEGSSTVLQTKVRNFSRS